MTIWNETIPGELRRRMAAIEQLSYMSGPLLGNARAGFMAERLGLARSITVGWHRLRCWRDRVRAPSAGLLALSSIRLKRR